MDSLVTTRNGDAGESQALDGSTYSKAHPIMECVGMIDEVRARTALLRLLIIREKLDDEALEEFLTWLLHVYFLLGTECSDPERKKPEYRAVPFSRTFLVKLEEEQMRIEGLVELEGVFIAGASNDLAAHTDLARTATRQLERAVLILKEAVPTFEADEIIAFVNRLSDYFFVLARYLEGENHMPVDYDLLK
jgi:cob(I)alamin adenosyltransferase